MYVEDESDKTIRLAKRKAYGPCDKHQGHFNGMDFFSGMFVVAFPVFIAALLYFAPGESKTKNVNIQYSCTSSDSKTGSMTGYSGYLILPAALSIEANSTCTFASN